MNDDMDVPEKACQSWIVAWRDANRTAHKPPLTFARHLGVDAVGLWREDVGVVELQRVFAAAGYDGVCMCGLTPAQVIAKEAAA